MYSFHVDSCSEIQSDNCLLNISIRTSNWCLISFMIGGILSVYLMLCNIPGIVQFLAHSRCMLTK